MTEDQERVAEFNPKLALTDAEIAENLRRAGELIRKAETLMRACPKDILTSVHRFALHAQYSRSGIENEAMFIREGLGHDSLASPSIPTHSERHMVSFEDQDDD